VERKQQQGQNSRGVTKIAQACPAAEWIVL